MHVRESHGFPEFQASCEAVPMGRTTFEPAIANERWPWPDLDVFVLDSHRPPGTPEEVVVDSDPERLEKLRGGQPGPRRPPRGRPSHDREFRALGGLDKLGLIVLPLLFGAGMQLTPTFNPEPS